MGNSPHPPPRGMRRPGVPTFTLALIFLLLIEIEIGFDRRGRNLDARLCVRPCLVSEEAAMAIMNAFGMRRRRRKTDDKEEEEDEDLLIPS